MKFRRNKSDEAVAPADGGPADVDADQSPASHEPRAHGPWDSAEVTIDEDDPTKIDLGGLVVTGKPGLELRLQVDEATQQVAAVLLIGPDGGVELRPFAAPRNSEIWDDIRKHIAAETAQRGGTATEVEGVYGKELQVVVSVTTPEGKSGTQTSRVLGISGPRWLLRATFLGKPALEPQADGDVEKALREVIVVRGNDPMAPGDPLPLTMPANATPMQQRPS